MLAVRTHGPSAPARTVPAKALTLRAVPVARDGALEVEAPPAAPSHSDDLRLPQRTRRTGPEVQAALARMLQTAPVLDGRNTDDALREARMREHLAALQHAGAWVRSRPLGRSLSLVPRAYQASDLMTVAELAYHYLRNGAGDHARTLLEGLTSVSPAESYFALALALTHDHLGALESAFYWLQKAAKLDPRNPRADINRAELHLREGRPDQAMMWLRRGLRKAQATGETALATKATALLNHLRASATQTARQKGGIARPRSARVRREAPRP